MKKAALMVAERARIRPRRARRVDMAEWLYGRHAVEEALRAGRRKVFRLLRAEPEAKSLPAHEAKRQGTPEEAVNLARQKGVSIERVPAARLDALTRVGHHHQGVAAEVS